MSQTKAQLISDLVQALNFTGTSSAPANGMYLSAANTIKLATNSNGRLTIDSSGNAVFTGTCTATTFIGALTGTASGNPTLANGANDRLVTATGSSTLNGEADLTFDGNSLNHVVGANTHGIKSTAAGDHYTTLQFNSNRSGDGEILSIIDFQWDGDKVADILCESGSDDTNKDDGHLSFRTSLSQGSITERFKIQNDGTKVMSNGRLTMSSAFIDFSGNVSTPQTGAAIFRPAADTLAFSINNNERIRIDSSGRLLIGHTATRAIAGGNSLLQIEKNSSELATFLRTSNDTGAPWLALAKSRSSAGAACQAGDQIGGIAFVPHDGTDLNHHAAEIRGYVDTGIGTDDTPGYLTFHTNSGNPTTGERLRINKTGNVMTAGLSEPLGYGYHGANSTTFTIYDANANGGVLEVGGNPYLNSYNAGSIGFMNNNNSDGSTPWSAGSKFVHLIRAQIYTSDNNAGDDSGADLVFYRKNEAAAGTEGMRIKHNGDVSLADGNLVIGQAGKGIDFSAQTPSSATGATTSSEVLDHYEEGSWTPTFNGYGGTAGSFTYAGTTGGKYTKIGNQVSLWWYCAITNMATLPGGNYLTLNNLPFTNNAGAPVSEGASAVINWWDPAGAGVGEGHNIVGFVQNNTTRIVFGEQTENGIGGFNPTQFFGSSTGANTSYMYGYTSYISS